MKKSPLFALLGMLLVFLLACNTTGGTGGGGTGSANFVIALNPTSLNAAPGSSATTQLTVTPQNGFSGTVNLSLVDSNGAAVSGITLTPTSVNVSGGSAVNQNLTVGVGTGVAAGTYNLKVRATASNQTKEADLTLTVQSGPSFTISLNPTSLTATQGESKTTQLTLTRQNGFSGTVSLSLVNPPAGVTVSPTSLSVGSSNVQQNLTIATSANTPVGQHTLTLKAASGTIERTATLTLVVNQATAFTVNTTADTIDADPGNGQCADSNGNCSLRAAVMEANALGAPVIINLPAGTYTLTRTSSIDEQGDDLDLKSNITLKGADQATTILDGNNATRVVEIYSGKSATLENLTLRGAPTSEAALLNRGTATLANVNISDNAGIGFYDDWSGTATTLTNVTISNNATGFYKYSDGTTTLTNVTISNNGTGFYNDRYLQTAILTNVTINNNGTGLYNRSGIAILRNATVSGNRNRGILTDFASNTILTNVTVSGNSTTSSYGGGGIYNSSGTLNIAFSTITNNTAPRGGGLRIYSGTVKLKGVILAGNTATGGTGPECEGSLSSLGYNLIKSNADCSFTRDSTDILNQDPNLGALANNGGPVQTHLPNAGSPVLDKVPASACTDLSNNVVSTDARGITRPQNGSCDIGAVEKN